MEKETSEQVKAVAKLVPNILVAEPTELIGDTQSLRRENGEIRNNNYGQFIGNL